MANKVTGSTDTSGALTTAPSAIKEILLVGAVNKADGETTTTVDPNTKFSISGTTDATGYFGSLSVIPKMVRVLIQNGVDNICGMIVDSTSETKYADALSATLTEQNIKVILLDDFTTAANLTALKTHLTVAESNDLFRYSVVAPTIAQTATQSSLVTFAATVDSNRIFIPAAVFTIDDTDQSPEINASALAALIMTETDDPALPMNSVSVVGFNGVKRPMLESEMNILVTKGVTPFYLDGTSPCVWRLVTAAVTVAQGGAGSNNTGIWTEGTTRFIADYVLENNEAMLRVKYKRTKNIPRVLKAIRDDLKINMEKFEGLEIIENWDESTLTVIKDPNDNFGALVDYEFDVVTPLYTITITQHMKI